MNKNIKLTGLSNMSKLVLVMGMLLLVCISVFALPSPKIHVAAMRSPAILVEPPINSSPITAPSISLVSGGSHGASQSFKEYLLSCKGHYNYNFVLKAWNWIEKKTDAECNQGWSKYLSRSKIRFTTKDFYYTTK